MTRRRSSILLLAALVLASLPAAASAGKPGTWTAVTSADGANIDEVALLRTGPTLQVFWHRKSPGNPVLADLLRTPITAAGKVGAAQAIASGWVGIGNAAVGRTAAGAVTLVAGATQTVDATSIADIAGWTSADGGTTWAAPTEVADGGGFSDDPGLAIGPDGATPFFAWGTTFGLFVHRGLDRATPSANLQTAAGFGCCGYSPGVAVDGASKQVVVAWYSNATGHTGVFAQAVDAGTLAPVGAPALMPHSTDGGSTSASLAHTPIVGRPGKPGVFVAYATDYPTTTDVRVWKFGSSSSTRLAKVAGGVRNVTLATTPEGRLWALWTAGDRLYARRSNKAVTTWAPAVSAKVRAGTGTTFKLAADGQVGPVDVLAAFAPEGKNGVQTWHTQLYPRLTAKASPSSVRAGHATKVAVTVTDVGDAVAGARMRVGAATATTGASGRATLTVSSKSARTLAVSATKAGFTAGRASVRVR